MSDYVKPTDNELRMRASWLSLLYHVDADRVFNILSKIPVRELSAIDGESFRYLEFDLSLEVALKYLRPSIALAIFEKWEQPDIVCLLATLKCELHDVGKSGPGVEELCRWEHESYFLIN